MTDFEAISHGMGRTPERAALNSMINVPGLWPAAWLRCAVTPFAALLLACADRVPDATSQSTTPSEWRTERVEVGDTVLYRTHNAESRAVGLTLVEEVSIGQSDGGKDYLFTLLLSVTPLQDGGVLLYESGAKQVKHYDSAGRFVRNYGRLGDGPGEYRSVGGKDIAIAPDGHVFVQAEGHVWRYAPDGSYLDGTPATGMIAALTQDGVLHMETLLLPPGVAMIFTSSSGTPAVVRVDSKGTILDTILEPKAVREPRLLEYRRRPPGPLAARDPNRSAVGQALIPLEPYFVATYSPLGYWITADPRKYAIDLHMAGAPHARIESDVAAVPATSQERTELLQYMMWYNSTLAESMTADVSIIPERKPFFRGIRADHDGRIWVELHQMAERVPFDTIRRPQLRSRLRQTARYGSVPPAYLWEEPVVYDVFEPSGEYLGRLPMPPNSTFEAAFNGKVWLSHRDDLGVPRLVRYAVQRDGAEAFKTRQR